MTRRAYITIKTKLAAALLQLRDADGHALIPHEDAKLMTADQIVSLFAFDHHPIPKHAGGADEPWNLDPRMIVPHRRKTAKIDVPALGKQRRISRANEEHVRRLLAKDKGEEKPRSRWGKRPLRSRNDLRRRP